MNLEDAEVIASGLISLHLTSGEWRFKWDDAPRRFGCCRWDTKTISLSRRLVGMNSFYEVQNTILHEIAHALCGRAEGHGPRWAATHRRLGGDGLRCYSAAKVNTPPRVVHLRLD